MMYDKFAFNDPEGLPDWFTSEEKKHRFRRPPEVSKELVAMYKERQKEANVKTIKKIAEAKARKKRKAAKKMESARKAAEGVLNQEDVSAKEKSAQIKRIYNKAGLKKIMVSLELYWMWSHSLHHDKHIKPKPMGESRKSLNQIWVASTSRPHEK